MPNWYFKSSHLEKHRMVISTNLMVAVVPDYFGCWKIEPVQTEVKCSHHFPYCNLLYLCTGTSLASAMHLVRLINEFRIVPDTSGNTVAELFIHSYDLLYLVKAFK